MQITNASGENPVVGTCNEPTTKSSAASSPRSSRSCSSQVLSSPAPSSRFRCLFDAALVERNDVLLLNLCEIFIEISHMMSSWNYVFQVAVIDLQKKVERIRAAVGEKPKKYRSMQAAADYERDVGLFLKKEGITHVLISLHRTMRFTIAFLDGIRRTDPSVETSTVAREAYADSVARHHNWATRKMTSAFMASVPSRREMMGSILKQDGNGFTEAEFLDGFLRRAEILRDRSDSILGKE